MKNYFSNLSKIRKHKSLHKDSLNLIDINSNDVTLNGLLPNDQLWNKELPNEKNEETIFIYGTNSKRHYLVLKFSRRPVSNDSGDKVIYHYYNYELQLDIGNGNHYSVKETGVLYKSSKRESYQFPGLLLQVLEPFQRWRIKFNGYLRDKNNELIFVRMRLFWNSNSEVFDFKANCDTSYLAKQLSYSNIGIDVIFEDRYVGCGQLEGIIQLNDEKEQEIYLWGSRSKAISSHKNKEFDKETIMGYSEKGIAFEINKVKEKDSNRSCIYGFGSTAQGFIYPIEAFEYDGLEFEKNLSLFPENFKYKINGKYFTVENLEIRKNGICYFSNNKHKGSGIFIYDNEKQQIADVIQNTNSLKLDDLEDSMELVLRFDDKLASNERITGGKGSSLSILKNLCLSEKNNFIVPNGFIVTTNSYQMLLRENTELKSAIDKLERISWSETRENLSNECANLVNLFATLEIPHLVKASIRDALKCVDPNNSNYENILLAIRSSACGEDSEDMSAAGQMTTYLGIKGLDNICRCVMKCWSSQFSITAIEYKRGYGQLINTPMAVVVQEIIDCDVAGVMFTCDPITGDERKILITSNYGIGESVVSSSVNPDNITLSVSLESNSLSNKRFIQSLNSINVGAKETSIKINKSSGFGTQVKSNNGSPDKCSLSESEAIKLGEIGLRIHSYFESARDIEWGIKDGIFYLFQSRPVTNLDAYNEWELMHELDTGHTDETEYNTRANVGEIMPGAQSHLYLTSIFKQLGVFIGQRLNKLYNIRICPHRRYCDSVCLHSNSTFFNLKDIGSFQFGPEEHETFLHKALVIAVFGHSIEDQQLRADCFERNGEQSFKTKLKMQKDMIRILFNSKRKLSSTLKKYQNFDLLKDQNFNNSSEMIEHLMNNLYLLLEPVESHLDVSIKSSVYNLLLLSILSNGDINLETHPTLVTDFANVLSMTGHNIVSAGVPTAIKRLAQSISNTEMFKQMKPEEALEWILNTEEESGKLYKKFIEDHGHRGYKEADVMSNTWKDTPLLLIQIIQTMLPIKEKQNEETLTSDDICANIKTPLSRKNRILLKKWIIPSCHKSICEREEGKSFVIRIIDKLRQFIREMAKMMSYKEGRIPEPDLIFYLKIHELIKLTKFRDPKIVAKAKQRKRVFPKLDKFFYDEIIIGPQMKPTNLIDENFEKQKYLNGPNSVIKGTPVSTGSVTARVCVAKYFEDSKLIQPGDILVTYSTDIGWSPYFAMLSGIITEIGGLISHGAVIAREYGVPCLVGVERACNLLYTGDTILLDADNGQIVLMRVSNN